MAMTMINNNRAKSRLFLCFQPVVLESPEESEFNKGLGGDQVVAFVDVKRGDVDAMVPANLLSSPLLREDERLKKKKKSKKVSLRKGSAAAAGGRGRKGTTTGRIISRIAKVVLFDTKLAKKIRNRKVQHDPSKQDERTEMDSVVSDSKSGRESSKEEDYARIEATESSLSGSSSPLISSSSFSSSSRSSSMASSLAVSNSNNSSSMPVIDRMKSCEPKQSSNQSEMPKQRKTKRSAENHNSGLYLLVVSLLALIFFGRFCAILWTATCFFLLPSRRSNDDSSRPVLKTPDIQSRDYRKRVLMQGFLERNRR